MLRLVYLLGMLYVAVCSAVLFQFRPEAAPPPVHPPHASDPPVGGEGQPEAWFARTKPYCNAVEVQNRLRFDPAPASGSWMSVGYEAACLALAGQVPAARDRILGLADQRPAAASIVFGVGHPVADAGDDRSAGPIMELVLEFMPDHYMARYHAGMSAHALGQADRAGPHLRRFLELYPPDDGWRRNALVVLGRLESD